jgi:hypothetical protein
MSVDEPSPVLDDDPYPVPDDDTPSVPDDDPPPVPDDDPPPVTDDPPFVPDDEPSEPLPGRRPGAARTFASETDALLTRWKLVDTLMVVLVISAAIALVVYRFVSEMHTNSQLIDT